MTYKEVQYHAAELPEPVEGQAKAIAVGDRASARVEK
jgi:hypothetical protein